MPSSPAGLSTARLAYLVEPAGRESTGGGDSFRFYSSRRLTAMGRRAARKAGGQPADQAHEQGEDDPHQDQDGRDLEAKGDVGERLQFIVPTV
jgi:hypothetical protein